MEKKSRIIILINFIAYLLFSLSLQANSDTLSLNHQANKLFVADQYDAAIKKYRQVEKQVNEHDKKSICSYQYKFSQVEIVKERKSLGQITPDYTHNIKVIYIKNTDSSSPANYSKISKEVIEKNHISLLLAKQYLEVLSKGKFSINYDIQVIENKLTRFNKISYKQGYKFFQPDIESLIPFPESSLIDDIKNFDSFIFYYTTKDVLTRATGELIKFPLIPYQFRSAKRGIIRIPTELNRACSLVHEFFHIIEDIYKIRPRHGYRNALRNKFPNWKGDGQWSYYRWHFEKIASSQGFNYTQLSKIFPLPEEVDLVKLKEKFKLIPLDNRLLADTLFKKVIKAEKPKRSDRKLQLKQSLNLNPEHVGALTRLAQYEYFDKKYSQAKAYINLAYDLNPWDSDVLYWRSILLNKYKQTDSSLRELDKLIQLDPLYSRAYVLKGTIFFKRNKLKQSLSLFRQAIKSDKRTKKSIKNFLLSTKSKGKSTKLLHKLNY